MSTADDLYRQACDGAAGISTPDMDAEMRRIWVLIGALSEAFWRRQNEPGFSIVQAMVRNSERYAPESEDELAIWAELTAPHNHGAVARYATLGQGNESDYAVRLHATILEESRRRRDSERPADKPQNGNCVSGGIE